MMDDHPDLRDFGGPIRFVEVQPHRDQMHKALAGLFSAVTLLLLVVSVPVAVLLYRAAF